MFAPNAPVRIMGILNLSPDSFSDGGRFVEPAVALAHAQAMAMEGADIIDVGGESTRPGARAVDQQEELDRVLPVIEAIAAELSVTISIDTSKPEVMRAAVAAGAGLINDVRALREDGALGAAAELGVPVCLMHMQGQPRRMQDAPHYQDVVSEVRAFLLERVAQCEDAGMARDQMVIDPGFGFGKTLDHNLQLLRGLGELAETGLPVLVGISRKSMIGALTDRPVDQRVSGSIAAATVAVLNGASVLRVHDVAATADAVRVAEAIGEQEQS